VEKREEEEEDDDVEAKEKVWDDGANASTEEVATMANTARMVVFMLTESK